MSVNETAAPTTDRQAKLALVGLLLVAVAWGSSFPLTKKLLAQVTPIDFLAQRFALAALLMAVVFFPAIRRLSRTALIRGVLLGALYGVAQIAQTIGLGHTSASISGFITGMYVVLTPVCGVILLKTRITARWWVGAGLACLGLAVMSLNGFSVGLGEGVTLFSALLYALHIVGLGHWSTGSEAVGLAAVQVITTAAVCIVTAAPGGIQVITGTGSWLAVIYMAVVSGALAMIIQSWAQAHLPASRAAIIMCTEPVWAAGLAIAFFGEPLSIRIGVGGALMLVAMLVVELSPRAPGDPPRPEDLPKLAA